MNENGGTGNGDGDWGGEVNFSEQYARAISGIEWAESPTACACRGSGFTTTDFDTAEQCPVHFYEGAPHPHDDDGVWIAANVEGEGADEARREMLRRCWEDARATTGLTQGQFTTAVSCAAVMYWVTSVAQTPRAYGSRAWGESESSPWPRLVTFDDPPSESFPHGRAGVRPGTKARIRFDLRPSAIDQSVVYCWEWKFSPDAADYLGRLHHRPRRLGRDERGRAKFLTYGPEMSYENEDGAGTVPVWCKADILKAGAVLASVSPPAGLGGFKIQAPREDGNPREWAEIRFPAAPSEWLAWALRHDMIDNLGDLVGFAWEVAVDIATSAER